LQSPFHAYYTARLLDTLSDEDDLIPVFASSDIQVYPFQIAAASFALRSPYQKGVILCDEAGMGKSHEAMLVIVQKWLEGQHHILLVIPNADLLTQWVEMMEKYYTIPYLALFRRSDWEANVNPDTPNAFHQEALVLTTYDFAADHEEEAKAVRWDLTVFEEANALSPVYQEGSKQAKALKRIAEGSFKLLLTGTPIEKNIMDLYGMIWFIDEAVLPREQEFLARYLRRPENYPELSQRVSRYCFRTLRSQARNYANVTERVLLTEEYTPSSEERRLYDLLDAYIHKAGKQAFPEMDPYDLALRLLSLQSSSTAAILQTIRGILKRLKVMPDAQREIAEWEEMRMVAQNIQQDAKANELLSALQSGFALMKQRGAKQKAVIFTESVETQKMLFSLLRENYKTTVYNGSSDYSAIREFKEFGEILISTDNGAKGFNLEEASFVIHYDLLYNSLKMEQRIDRCHRLGQQNDVLSLAFINKENFSDVRKLELINKRMLVSDGVFGVTGEVVGGFTDDMSAAWSTASERLRTREKVREDYQQTLAENEQENRQIVSTAENVLFTTFTRELSDKVKISPQYVNKKADEINDELWRVVKWFFEKYNSTHDDCMFQIDDKARTVTATNYQKLPVLFYYWNGSRNQKYKSQKAYGMAKDFKPRYGRITLTSIIGRGILHEVACADKGTLTVNADVEPCEIGLYTVSIACKADRCIKEQVVFCGRTKGGRVLDDGECRRLLSLPVIAFTEDGYSSAHWLKGQSRPKGLDKLVPVDALLTQQAKKRSPAQAEELDRMRLETATAKNALGRALGELEAQIKAVEQKKEGITNRMQLLALDKKLNILRREVRQRKERQFFDAMRLDMELEQKIKAFTQQEALTAKITREFILTMDGKIDNIGQVC